MSEVDTFWAWGGQTSTPPISKYLIQIFFPSHIKLYFKLDRKNKKKVVRDSKFELEAYENSLLDFKCRHRYILS